LSAKHHLVVGLGITGAAVAEALTERGEHVVAVDDTPGPAVRERARAAGVELVEAPSTAELAVLVASALDVLPAPGLPYRHPVFELAAAAGIPVRSEFDLAREWDDRPLLAVTGTDGKTTVVTLVERMLDASGVRAVAAGNTEIPLVAAIADPKIAVFVVEASSFRLAHSQRFAPDVATWLNLAPDHLDGHSDVDEYAEAKARIWRDQRGDQVAVGNAEDATVQRYLSSAPARHVTFGLESGDYRVRGDELVDEAGMALIAVHDLRRSLPHDVANDLAAAATAMSGGATREGVRSVLRDFGGLPHRVELVGEADGVSFYNDSKATTPHAAAAAIGSFDSVVLIAGGRNKGLDLRALADAGDERVHTVVAIGEAASDVAAAFDGRATVVEAESMDDAVARAAAHARPGDAVLLSPGCASYDWYANYQERGTDFSRAVRELVR
jgi:UDP-N-acetylmuramoylalanine--D-glutamate ligase